MTDEQKAVLAEMTRDIAKKGLLVETGWMAFIVTTMPETATENQKRAMRLAYFAGAQHLWASLNLILGDGKNVTDGDIEPLRQIETELADWVNSLTEH